MRGADLRKHDLMSVPFNPSNINLFGTIILKILFADEDQGRGTIEPGRSNKPTLDLGKINLIKGKNYFLKILFKEKKRTIRFI